LFELRLLAAASKHRLVGDRKWWFWRRDLQFWYWIWADKYNSQFVGFSSTTRRADRKPCSRYVTIIRQESFSWKWFFSRNNGTVIASAFWEPGKQLTIRLVNCIGLCECRK